MARLTFLLLNTLALAAAMPQQPEQVVLGQDAEILKSAPFPREIEKALEKGGIFKIIDKFTPNLTIEAIWSPTTAALLGNELKPKELKDQPSVLLLNPAMNSWHCRPGVTYAVAMTDPDAPSRKNPKWSEICHWIATATSFPDNNDDSGAGECLRVKLSDLKDVMPYKAPGPPKETGPHRYALFAFVASNSTTETLNPTKPEDRQHWGYKKKGHGVADWAKENGLEPVAANFFYARYHKEKE